MMVVRCRIGYEGDWAYLPGRSIQAVMPYLLGMDADQEEWIVKVLFDGGWRAVLTDGRMSKEKAKDLAWKIAIGVED